MMQQLLRHDAATNPSGQTGQPDGIKRAAHRPGRCAASCPVASFFEAKLWFQRFVKLLPDVFEDPFAEARLLPNLFALAVIEVVLRDAS